MAKETGALTPAEARELTDNARQKLAEMGSYIVEIKDRYDGDTYRRVVVGRDAALALKELAEGKGFEVATASPDTLEATRNWLEQQPEVKP